MVWLVPLYALAAWAVVQAVELARLAARRRVATPALAAVAVLFVAAIGSIDLANSVRSTPYDIRLSDEWRDARTGAPVRYEAGVYPAGSDNRFYLACDPPYDWESEIWYLDDVLHPGKGRTLASHRGAFRERPPCLKG
jgi:hypothetical protein